MGPQYFPCEHFGTVFESAESQIEKKCRRKGYSKRLWNEDCGRWQLGGQWHEYQCIEVDEQKERELAAEKRAVAYRKRG